MKTSEIWQLPVNGAERTGNAYIPPQAKYHYFVNNTSLCQKYNQITENYDDGISTESGTVLSNPEIACKHCFSIWKKQNINL